LENTFFDLVDERIKEKNLTKKEVAKHIGVSESAFSKILSSRRKIHLEALIKLAHYLELSCRELSILAARSGGISVRIKKTYKGDDPAKLVDSLVRDANFLSKEFFTVYEKDNNGKGGDIIHIPLRQDNKISSFDDALDKLSVRDLKDMARKFHIIKEELDKLKDYKFALEYSLKDKVPNDFIAKLEKYIGLEIDLTGKSN
jgi:transcriptional regulator with XRE-family HTH domain